MAIHLLYRTVQCPTLRIYATSLRLRHGSCATRIFVCHHADTRIRDSECEATFRIHALADRNALPRL